MRGTGVLQGRGGARAPGGGERGEEGEERVRRGGGGEEWGEVAGGWAQRPSCRLGGANTGPPVKFASQVNRWVLVGVPCDI